MSLFVLRFAQLQFNTVFVLSDVLESGILHRFPVLNLKPLPCTHTCKTSTHRSLLSSLDFMLNQLNQNSPVNKIQPEIDPSHDGGGFRTRALTEGGVFSMKQCSIMLFIYHL